MLQKWAKFTQLGPIRDHRVIWLPKDAAQVILGSNRTQVIQQISRRIISNNIQVKFRVKCLQLTPPNE